MNRDDHERAIFLQALNLPGGSTSAIRSRLSASWRASRRSRSRSSQLRDDPVLDGLAQLARAAWADFLARDDETP